jgi:hypothetical protein
VAVANPLGVYLLKARVGRLPRPAYDCLLGAVVVARNEHAARDLLRDACRDECVREHRRGEAGPCVWTEPEFADCERIGDAYPAERAGVVLTEFAAG